MPQHPSETFLKKDAKVVIIGAGVVGLGIAWRLAGRGFDVTVFDKGIAGSGASHAAAGMLAACVEAEPGEEALVRLGREAQKQWPAFADELERETGLSIERRQDGTMVVATNSDDQARLAHLLRFQHQLGLPLTWINAADARKREPHLAANIAGAVFSPQDHQVENRKLAAALLAAAITAGARIREHCAVASVATRGGRANGVQLADGNLHEADIVVLAAGAWSRGIEGIAKELRPPVRPLKGQMIALQMDVSAPLLRHVVWGPNVYLVPRNDGRLLIGATLEEKGFDQAMTAGGLLALLEAAWRIVPGIEELNVQEMWAGHRPGSRDDAPILGASGIDGLVYATGHHRNGILLTPVTTDFIADYIATGRIDPAIAPFGMERFARKVAAE